MVHWFHLQFTDYQQKANEKLRKFTGTRTTSGALPLGQTTVEKELELNKVEEESLVQVEGVVHKKETEPSTSDVSNDSKLVQMDTVELENASSQST